MATAPRIVRANPNASVAAGGTGVGVLAVWGLTAVGVDVSPEAAGVIAGAIPTAVLFVGKNGVKGVAQRVWSGPTPPKKAGP